MLQSLLATMTVTPDDVQIWECNPLLILGGSGEVVFGKATNLEFTPLDSAAAVVGHAICLTPGDDGVCPEIAIATRQYIDNPIEMARRQGIILQGTDQNDHPVTWLINGAADRFLTTPDAEQLEYDEETAKMLEEELEGEPEKLNLNSYL
jgi:hypothetical protein